MLNATAFANAAAAVMAVFYVICAVLSFVAPDLLFSLARSWMHTINLESVRANFTPDMGLLVYGLVSATALTWLTTYVIIALYNRFTK